MQIKVTSRLARYVRIKKIPRKVLLAHSNLALEGRIWPDFVKIARFCGSHKPPLRPSRPGLKRRMWKVEILAPICVPLILIFVDILLAFNSWLLVIYVTLGFCIASEYLVACSNHVAATFSFENVYSKTPGLSRFGEETITIAQPVNSGAFC